MLSISLAWSPTSATVKPRETSRPSCRRRPRRPISLLWKPPPKVKTSWWRNISKAALSRMRRWCAASRMWSTPEPSSRFSVPRADARSARSPYWTISSTLCRPRSMPLHAWPRARTARRSWNHPTRRLWPPMSGRRLQTHSWARWPISVCSPAPSWPMRGCGTRAKVRKSVCRGCTSSAARSRLPRRSSTRAISPLCPSWPSPQPATPFAIRDIPSRSKNQISRLPCTA